MENEMVFVPKRINRMRHLEVLSVWNECGLKHETLETTWSLLVDAMLNAERNNPILRPDHYEEGMYEASCERASMRAHMAEGKGDGVQP